MRQPLVIATALGLLLALVGCGAQPASSRLAYKRLSARPAQARAVSQPKAPLGSGTVSHRPGAAALPKPTPTPPPSAPVKAPAAAPGELSLALALVDGAEAESLALRVYPAADPQAFKEHTLSVSGGRASWSAQALPAGRYVLSVQAYAAGSLLGQGSTEAVVKSGQLTRVSLDLRLSAAATQSTNSTAGAVALDVEIL